MKDYGIPDVIVQKIVPIGLAYKAIRVAAAICSVNGWAFSLLEVDPRIKNENCVLVTVKIFPKPEIDILFTRDTESTKWIADQAHVIFSSDNSGENMFYAVEDEDPNSQLQFAVCQYPTIKP